MSTPTAQGWNERYGRADYLFGTDPNDFLAEYANLIPPGPVLCLAEGEGRNAVFLAKSGHDVTAVDQSAVGLEKAQQLASDNQVVIATVVSGLEEFTIEPGAWSGIVSIFVHIPPKLRRSVYERAVAGLKPGGVFLLEAYTPKQIGLGTGGPSDPVLTPSLAQLEQELIGLEFVIGRELRRDVIEGVGHTGAAEVVQVLGRKRPD